MTTQINTSELKKELSNFLGFKVNVKKSGCSYHKNSVTITIVDIEIVKRQGKTMISAPLQPEFQKLFDYLKENNFKHFYSGSGFVEISKHSFVGSQISVVKCE